MLLDRLTLNVVFWCLGRNNCCVSFLSFTTSQPSWLLCRQQPRPLDSRLFAKWLQRDRVVIHHTVPSPHHILRGSSRLRLLLTTQCCDVVYLACWQNLWPPRRLRPHTASEMLLDGFCGQRHLMIWRISDMVSVVDRWSMKWWVCCACKLQEKSTYMQKQKSRTLIPSVVMSVDCQCWIFVDGYYTNTSYPISDIRNVHFQGKILWNVEVWAQCTQEFYRSKIGCCRIFRRRHWFLLGRNFERCIQILCPTIFLGLDTVKVRSDPSKIKVRYW
jgi:hypothetical protein